ncbi:hypothetical protein ACIP01_04655 [Pseudomonas monteilii]|uniref:hypothetical protein n=1 Tax=Pseudomonas monteilii TaxID=76759 RepID=UPI003826198D
MDYSTAELMRWLAEETRLLGWDIIFFIDGSKINAELKQESFRRFGTASDMPLISGSISNGTNSRFALCRCSLALPRLVFDVALAGHKAHMPMVIAEANAYSLTNKGNQWYVRQLDVMGPLQEASLSLDIDLEKSGGSVDEDGSIKLDLSKTENFSMPCYIGDTRLLTEFFRQKFSALTAEQRQFPIGQLVKGTVGVPHPVWFDLRTLARGRAVTDEEGAVVLLVNTKGRLGGDYPGADYKYAIPNDGDYSTTVLFDPDWMARAQLVLELRSMITDAEFEWRQGDGEPPSLVCKAGYISFPGQRTKEKVTFFSSGSSHVVTGEITVHESRVDMRDAVSIAKEGGVWVVYLRLRGSVMVSFDHIDDRLGELYDRLINEGYGLDGFHKPVQADFDFTVKSYYAFNNENVRLDHRHFEFGNLLSLSLFFGAIQPPSASDPMVSENDPFLTTVKKAILLITDDVKSRMRSRSSDEYICMADVVGGYLKRHIRFQEGAWAIANDVLNFDFHRTPIDSRLDAPLDIVLFGKVNPATNYFTISPMETSLLAGTTRRFVTEPAAALVRWSVKAVSGLAEGVPLSIALGVFTAPNATDMTKSYAQVLVTATSTINPTIQSRALITVVRETLQANPSVVVAQPGSKVNFNAWALGDPAALEWQYRGSSLGKGQTVTVTCPADSGEVAFVVEEVQVKDPESQQTSTCVLITEMAKKMPMAVSDNVDTAGTKAVLEARVNGNLVAPDKINWDVLYGPGEAPGGVYTPGNGDTARFALISATYDSDGFGIFEGYALLALPLAEHRDITTVQSD